MSDELIKRLRSQDAVDARPTEIERLTDEAADLIEQQAAKIADLESAEKDNGKLLTALAECRDAFPVPAAGAELEGHWLSAMANPEEVPAYVKACLESASKDAIRREALEAAAKICDERASAYWKAYKQSPIDDVNRANPHVEGMSDGAEHCANAIRALSQKAGTQQ